MFWFDQFHSSGPIFSKSYRQISWSLEAPRYYTDRIAPKFDRHLGSTVAEVKSEPESRGMRTCGKTSIRLVNRVFGFSSVWDKSTHTWERMRSFLLRFLRFSIIIGLSHLFTMFPSSHHREIFKSYYHWQQWCPCKRSESKIKVTESETQFSRFQTITPVWIHIWRWNYVQSLVLHRGGVLWFNKVICQISRSYGTEKRRFWPEWGVSGCWLQLELTLIGHDQWSDYHETNSKHFDFGHDLDWSWPWLVMTLILVMTLTLNFQGQI